MPTIATPFVIPKADTSPRVAAWSLTRAMSPRPSVRMAVVDAYGQILNQYTGQHRADAAEPDRPWAVYLADTERRFRLLCFDLDAKSAGAASAAARDSEVIAGLLRDAGLSSVVCQSGPAGGRHVWTALAESLDAETVATLGRLTRELCPTLDLSPLSNPVTGCVRPPGAPHRDGGRSTVLAGSLDALTHPTGTAAGIRALVERLASLVNTAEPAHTLDPTTPLPLDEHACLYLPGPRRPLPAVSAAALREDAASGDASAVLWRILIGAASARWRHADIAALVPTSPGLEHVRTSRDRGQRLARSQGEASRLLRRQWDKAVKHVASSPRKIGDDPTFDARAAAITTHVRTIQERADSATGRWTRGGGPADRRVLDVLCLLSLQALNASVEADTRRLALLAGIGRETARTALLRLSAEDWISQASPADGPHGAVWKIGPRNAIHSFPALARSQADPRPAGAGSAERISLLNQLTPRTHAAAHDVFTQGPGLGHLAGNTYAMISTEPQRLDDVTLLLGGPRSQTARTLDRLTAAGLLIHDFRGWRRPLIDPRSPAAARIGVAGRLADRTRRYRLERELWAWWKAEETWMNAPRRTAPRRRPGFGQLSLIPEAGTHAYGPYPRRSDGRADHKAAHRELTTQRGGIAAHRRPQKRRERVLAGAA